MDNTKNDAYYVAKISKDLSFIVEHTKEIDIEKLSQNEVLLDSMLFRLIQISENTKKLSDEYKENRPICSLDSDLRIEKQDRT